MKRIKKIDFWISITLIALFGFASIFFNNGHPYQTLLLGYIVVGTWQSISMIFHSIKGVFVRPWSRRFVYTGVSILAIAGFFTGGPWLYIMPWLAPLMAVYYTWLCYEETFIRLKRPLEL